MWWMMILCVMQPPKLEIQCRNERDAEAVRLPTCAPLHPCSSHDSRRHLFFLFSFVLYLVVHLVVFQLLSLNFFLLSLPG